MSEVPTIGNSNVLRKVASLTMDTSKIQTRPKTTPDKPPFQLYDKFEGEILRP